MTVNASTAKSVTVRYWVSFPPPCNRGRMMCVKLFSKANMPYGAMTETAIQTMLKVAHAGHDVGIISLEYR